MIAHEPVTGGQRPGTDDNDDRLTPGVWKVVSVAAIGSFMAQLDATVVNVSLASLAADLHVGLAAIQWVTSGYLLALALMLPLNGWLVDRIGAKALYLWCFAAFTLSSALCGLAWSANALIAFRILQGMSGGLLAPMAQMMIARVAGKHMAQVASIARAAALLDRTRPVLRCRSAGKTRLSRRKSHTSRKPMRARIVAAALDVLADGNVAEMTHRKIAICAKAPLAATSRLGRTRSVR